MDELLRLMLDSLSPFTNLFSRIHKVRVAGDVVSVEYAARLVSRDHHRDLLVACQENEVLALYCEVPID